jgi:hypothetical protein
MLWAFGAIMYLLEPKGGEGGRSMGLFYCLILSFLPSYHTSYVIPKGVAENRFEMCILQHRRDVDV